MQVSEMNIRHDLLTALLSMGKQFTLYLSDNLPSNEDKTFFAGLRVEGITQEAFLYKMFLNGGDRRAISFVCSILRKANHETCSSLPYLSLIAMSLDWLKFVCRWGVVQFSTLRVLCISRAELEGGFLSEETQYFLSEKLNEEFLSQ